MREPAAEKLYWMRHARKAGVMVRQKRKTLFHTTRRIARARALRRKGLFALPTK